MQSWLLLVNRTIQGPYNREQIQELLKLKKVSYNDLAFVFPSKGPQKSSWKFIWQFSDFDRRSPDSVPKFILDRREEKKSEWIQVEIENRLAPEALDIPLEDLSFNPKKEALAPTEEILPPEEKLIIPIKMSWILIPTGVLGTLFLLLKLQHRMRGPIETASVTQAPSPFKIAPTPRRETTRLPPTSPVLQLPKTRYTPTPPDLVPPTTSAPPLPQFPVPGIPSLPPNGGPPGIAAQLPQAGPQQFFPRDMPQREEVEEGEIPEPDDVVEPPAIRGMVRGEKGSKREQDEVEPGEEAQENEP